MGEMRKFMEKTGRKRPLVRPRHRWENNIGIYLGEMGRKSVDRCIWLRIRTHGGFL
jgi:hypothetical protein